LYVQECNAKHVTVAQKNGTCAPNKNRTECPGNSLKMAPVVCKHHDDLVTCLSTPCCAWNGVGKNAYEKVHGVLRGSQGAQGPRGPQGPALSLDYSQYDSQAQLDHVRLVKGKVIMSAYNGTQVPSTLPGIHRDVAAAVKACYGLHPTKDKCEFKKGSKKVTGICWHSNAVDSITFCSEKFALDVANWELAFAACFTDTRKNQTKRLWYPGKKCSFYGADRTTIKGVCLPKKFMAVHTHFSSRKGLLEKAKK